MTSPAVVARSRRYDPAPAPDLRLIERPMRPTCTPARVRPAVALALAVVLVFSTLIAAAIVHSMLVSGQAELDTVTTQTRTEQEALELEQLHLATLQSPARITLEAERMGMVPTERDNWLAAQPTPGGPSTQVTETPPPASAPTSAEAELAGASVDDDGPTP